MIVAPSTLKTIIYDINYLVLTDLQLPTKSFYKLSQQKPLRHVAG